MSRLWRRKKKGEAEAFVAEAFMEDLQVVLLPRLRLQDVIATLSVHERPEEAIAGLMEHGSPEDAVTILTAIQECMGFSILGEEKKAVRALGELLNERGGMGLMMAVANMFGQRRGGVAMRSLDLMWDGIGDWRG